MPSRSIDSRNYGYRRRNNFWSTPFDPEMFSFAHVSHFGALKAAPTVTVIKGNFPGSSLNTTVWDEVEVSGGSVTVERGVGKIQTGTNAAGSVKVKSVEKGRFEAGQVTVYQSGVYAGLGVANNTRRWGLMDQSEQNGLFFELDGTTFKVVARAGGTDTAVESADFNGDITFTPGASNNTYRIHYSAGRALFQRAKQGNVVTLHTMVDSQYPLVEDLDLGLYYENTNTGNTTDVEMRVRGASASVFGSLQRYNTGSALLTSNFDSEVALGTVENYAIQTKFGRNPDTDTTTTPEDLWNGASVYTGFNATANENIEVLSASANDTGTLVDSGTADSGGRNTLVDADGDFVNDGVAVGDILVNDTQSAHGSITAVTATTITVFRMENGTQKVNNNPGDAYRVVSTNGTGAALIKVLQLLNADYEQQPSAYVIMNGTTGVTLTGDYMRCSRAYVVLAGSGGANAGEITIRQATTTANVFAVVPTSGQTVLGAFTVPAGKTMLLKRLRASIVRANGSAGSANIDFRVRNRGEVFRSIRVFEVQTGAPTEFTALGGIVLPEGTDMKFTIQAVSDNNTITDGAFEYLLIDN